MGCETCWSTVFVPKKGTKDMERHDKRLEEGECRCSRVTGEEKEIYRYYTPGIPLVYAFSPFP